MVAKKYFEEQGYNVESYYYLVRNRNKRENMPGFMKICEIFGEPKVRLLIDEAENVFGLLVKRSPLEIRIYSFIIKAGKTDFLLKLRKTTL
jgi:hypothetical protein